MVQAYFHVLHMSTGGGAPRVLAVINSVPIACENYSPCRIRRHGHAGPRTHPGCMSIRRRICFPDLQPAFLVSDTGQFIVIQLTDLLIVQPVLSLARCVQAANQIHQGGFARLARKNGGRSIGGIRDEGRRKKRFRSKGRACRSFGTTGELKLPSASQLVRTSFTRSGRTILFRSGTFSREIRIDRVRSVASVTVMLWSKAPEPPSIEGPNRSMTKAGAPAVLRPCTYGRNSGHWS